MLSDSIKKKQWLTVVVLILFFVTRWIFLKVETGAGDTLIVFIPEAIIIIALYGLSVFECDKFISAIILVFGSGMMCFLYGYTNDNDPTKTLLPLIYLPVLLFFINQSQEKNEEKGRLILKIIDVLPRAYVVGFPCVVMILFIKLGSFTFNFSIYTIVVFFLVALLYSMIMLSSVTIKSNRDKKGKRKTSNKFETQRMRTHFLLGIIAIIETAFYLLLCKDEKSIHIIPLLWIINIIFLYDQGHVLVCAFFERLNKKVKAFLYDNNSAAL